MTKHEEARKNVNCYRYLVDLYIPENNQGRQSLNVKQLDEYIETCEAHEKILLELKTLLIEMNTYGVYDD